MPSLNMLKGRFASAWSTIFRRPRFSYSATVPDSPFSDRTDWSWDDSDSSYSLINIDVPEVQSGDCYADGDDDEEYSWINRIRTLHRLEELKSPIGPTSPSQASSIFTKGKCLRPLFKKISALKEKFYARKEHSSRCYDDVPDDLSVDIFVSDLWEKE